MAECNLGELYKNGIGVGKDEAEAVKWYRRSAERGCGLGQDKLALMYLAGSGVPKDEAEALGWFRQSAQQECLPGQDHLGRLYAAGLGVEKDDVEAIRWFARQRKRVIQTRRATWAECTLLAAAWRRTTRKRSAGSAPQPRAVTRTHNTP